ncbi:MAG: hypothetical protein PHX72_02405 [Candidatus Shapirobacteria bacterium]|nr:hypothetical protein [Candidatus Shapirobacteria bacterium]
MVNEDNQEKKAAFLVLEAKIKRAYSLIQDAKDKIKEQQEMFRDSFENDPVYRDHETKHEEARGVLLATRQQILKDPAVALLETKIKDMRLSLRELQNSLSDDLQQYQALTGEKVIETDQGRLMEIVSKAKLVKRS